MDTRVAAYAAILDDGGRMLLVRWSAGWGAGRWALPGGGLEAGEDAPAAVVREVLEETGYRVEVDGLLGTDEVLVAPGDRVPASPEGVPLRAVAIVHRAHVIGGERRAERDGSTDAVAWFAAQALRDVETVPLVATARRWIGALAG